MKKRHYMVSSHREAAHILGLRNHPSFFAPRSEGLSIPSAHMSLKRRYCELTEGDKLRLHSLEGTSIKSLRYMVREMAHGDSESFTAYWSSINLLNKGRFISGHCVSLHIIRDNDCVHFIYVNRGARAERMKGKDRQPTVFVFTKDMAEAEQFAKKIAKAFKSGRTSIAAFLRESAGEVNTELSQLLVKKDQKTGNCTIANGNFSWFVDLVSRQMKTVPQQSFQQCVIHCKPEYQQLRITDRILAIEWMLRHKADYWSEQMFIYNFLQALEHLGRKGSLAMANFVSHMERNGLIYAVLEPLLCEDFPLVLEEYINTVIAKSHIIVNLQEVRRTMNANFRQFALDNLLRIAVPKLAEAKQRSLVENDISMMRYVNTGIQGSLINQNRNLLLLAAPELIKSQLEISKGYLEREKKTLQNMLQSDPTFIKNYLLITVLKGLPNQVKKNANMMNQLHFFNTAMVFRDRETMSKYFDGLCRICAKEDCARTGIRYSKDTFLMRWFITHLRRELELPQQRLLPLDLYFSADVNEYINKTITRLNGEYSVGCNASITTQIEEEQIQARLMV